MDQKSRYGSELAIRLSSEPEFREVVGFHAQQAVEKYLKAPLTRYQIEFPKTHVIRRLLVLLSTVEPAIAETLDEASWLTPFGAEIRYPGDMAEMLPGDEARACEISQRVRDSITAALARS